ncbi:VOC family protein [Novosphingobium sp. 9]|uniref:VOC family protein n=1 Tax=Novosphingobium sp. 9 TaxID=2025349 RepID=UPI0021B6C4AD|nr:VOC family protein [Novosphingobium sp. 9]
MIGISFVTLGCDDVARAKAFYREGFGWEPDFQMDDLAFYKMGSLTFALWEKAQLEGDMKRACAPAGSFSLAHNVESQAAVEALMDRLVAAGGTLLRAADAPEYGGWRGYVADPEGNAWEIAWNEQWSVDASGTVTFDV